MNHVIAFTGALYELTRWWNWERDSQHRATEAAAVWRDVLQQLVGQIDYSNPTEPTPCESETMPVQFRVSETCTLEYSNDGETWTAVQGWSNFAAACFVGPEGPQGPEGPEGPEGEPGVIGAQVVRVDGDTPPDFYLTPETKILTAVMQEQWFRGIRTTPLASLPTDHMPPHVIEMETYDNPGVWSLLAYIPGYGEAYAPPPISDDPLTDEQKKCLAAMNATEVFMRTFADIGAHLTEQLFDDPLELMRALADSVIGLLTRDPARSFFDELATIISFLVLQAEYASTVFDADDRAEFQQLLLDNASINPNGGVTFDREAVLTYMNARWTGEIPFVHQWGLMMDLVRFTGTEGLDRAGAVTFFTEPDCAPEWTYAVDFTERSGSWNAVNVNGCTATRTSNGWQGCGANDSATIRLENPTGFDPDRTITRYTVTWRSMEAHKNDVGTALLQTLQATGSGAEWFGHDGTTDVRYSELEGPYTGFFAYEIQGFGVEILSASISGTETAPEWD